MKTPAIGTIELSAPSRTAPPAVAREDWATHPNYPDQTLLLGSHASFLEVSAVLVQAAERDVSTSQISALFEHWMAAMRGHETYEEQKLYRYLEHRWDLDLDPLRAGHEALHTAREAVEDALADGERPRLRAALADHGEVLKAHLSLEEDVVIPALLGLEPEEFARYYDGDIDRLVTDSKT